MLLWYLWYVYLWYVYLFGRKIFWRNIFRPKLLRRKLFRRKLFDGNFLTETFRQKLFTRNFLTGTFLRELFDGNFSTKTFQRKLLTETFRRKLFEAKNIIFRRTLCVNVRFIPQRQFCLPKIQWEMRSVMTFSLHSASISWILEPSPQGLISSCSWRKTRSKVLRS